MEKNECMNWFCQFKPITFQLNYEFQAKPLTIGIHSFFPVHSSLLASTSNFKRNYSYSESLTLNRSVDCSALLSSCIVARQNKERIHLYFWVFFSFFFLWHNLFMWINSAFSFSFEYNISFWIWMLQHQWLNVQFHWLLCHFVCMYVSA